MLLCLSACALKTPLSMLDTPRCVPEVPVNEACVFVDLNNGSDANPGTKESPVKTPHRGLVLAKDTGQSKWGSARSVVVSKGNYYFNSSLITDSDNALVVTRGVSIYGGYDPSQNWKRDLVQNISHLEDTNSGTFSTACGIICPAVIYINSELDAQTVIDGLELQGSQVNNNAANSAISVIMSGSAQLNGPTISNNILRSGNSSSGSSLPNVPIRMHLTKNILITSNKIFLGTAGGTTGSTRGINISNSSNVEISGNTITGGNAINECVAMDINGMSGTLKIASNMISMGTGNVNVLGVRLLANPSIDTASIVSNAINGGQLNCAGGSCRMDAMNIGDSVVNIENNSISYGNANTTGTRNRTGIWIISGTKGGHTLKGNTINLTGSNWSEAYGISYTTISGTDAAVISDNTITMHNNTISASSAAINISSTLNNNVEVARNTIYGSSGMGDAARDLIFADPLGSGSHTIHHNQIYKNSAPVITVIPNGIKINQASVTDVYSNYVEVFDSSSESRGIYVSGGAPKIYNNLIVHNSSLTAAAAKSGIYCFTNCSGVIANNTILTFNGSAGASFGAGITMFSAAATPDFRNNLIVLRGTANRYGFNEAAAASPVRLQNNLIVDLGSGGTVFAYHNSANNGCTSGADCTASEINTASRTDSITASGNVSLTPTFVDAANNNYRLSSSSNSGIKDGGLNLSSIFTTDYDGVTRTVPWSIGAFETD